MATTSIFSRKKDLAYLAFFIIHIPIMFCVDLVPLYPEAYKPQALIDLRNWHITTNNDRFFLESTPAWFTWMMYAEAVYHVPLTLWAIGALIRDDPLVPLHLLVFGLECSITTAVCIVDFMDWSDFSNGDKIELLKLYGPYLALSALMALDMFFRLSKTLRIGKAKKA